MNTSFTREARERRSPKPRIKKDMNDSQTEGALIQNFDSESGPPDSNDDFAFLCKAPKPQKKKLKSISKSRIRSKSPLMVNPAKIIMEK